MVNMKNPNYEFQAKKKEEREKGWPKPNILFNDIGAQSGSNQIKLEKKPNIQVIIGQKTKKLKDVCMPCKLEGEC